MVYLYLLLIIVIAIIVYLFVCHNSFVKLENEVKEAFATMDVYLKKRWDLIPNIVDCVKGYAKHEKETLEEIVAIRNKTYNKMNDSKKVDVNNTISQDLTRLLALAESYPDLKANENFKELSKDLASVEEDIANSRKYYNATVRIFNNKVQMFPSNLVAKLFGYQSQKMFEIDNNEKENIKVDL